MLHREKDNWTHRIGWLHRGRRHVLDWRSHRPMSIEWRALVDLLYQQHSAPLLCHLNRLNHCINIDWKGKCLTVRNKVLKNDSFIFVFRLNWSVLDDGKDKVMFLTKDDLSTPSRIKLREDEGFDPWDQHGTSLRSFLSSHCGRFRFDTAERCD